MLSQRDERGEVGLLSLPALLDLAQPAKVLVVLKGRQDPSTERLIQEGGLHLGENYLQEAHERRKRLQNSMSMDLLNRLQWHFIGHIQRRKCAAIAELFSWVQSIDRLQTAERLSKHRIEFAQRADHELPRLNCCLQINLAAEASKSGFEVDIATPSASVDFAKTCIEIAELPGLKLRGLMVLPPFSCDAAKKRHWLRRARQLWESTAKLIAADPLAAALHRQGALSWDTLSMGTTHDWQLALEEGSTMIRLGRSL